MKPLLPLATLVTLAGTLAAQQQLVLPDYQYLSVSPTQVGATGTWNYWRGGIGGRFQILYEASHFLDAGVGGQITIDKLMFRGISGQPNLGGQSWAGVTVQVGATTLTATGMSPFFGINRAPGGSNSTTMGTAFTIPVTVLPSVGSTPNNYNIVLDLAAASASFNYNPLGAQPNLLIEVTMPSAPTSPSPSGTVMVFEDTLGSVRGRGLTSSSWSATGGALLNPPVVGVEFSAGSGGYSPPVPARNEFYGAACGGSPSSFYQTFLNGQPFDLAGSSLTLTPDLPPPIAPAQYFVTKGVQAINYAAALPAHLVSNVDEALHPFTLPWAFRYPGGPPAGTTTIVPSTNGFIWLDTSLPVTPDPTPSVTELLNGTARLLPFWYDFDCGANSWTRPTSGLCISVLGVAPTRKCYVTWLDVGVGNSVSGAGVGDHAVHDMQCVIDEATGAVEYHYGPGSLMPQYCSGETIAQGTYPGLVGFSVGRLNGPAVADPKTRDLSHEVPFWTPVEGYTNHMGLTATAVSDPGGVSYGGRMFAGQTLTWVASDVPTGVTFGLLLLDLAPSQPGLNLAFLGVPACMLSVTPNPVVMMFDLFPTSTQATGSVTIPNGWLGVDIYAQYLATDLWWPITAASNAIKHTVGLD